MKLRTITFIAAVLFTTAGYALITDFDGNYAKIPSITNPWCGKKIEIRKIRFNKFHIAWDLVTGEKTVIELDGKVDGNTIDFRKGKGKDIYGYIYTLSENKNKLVVTLTVPNKTIICEFERTGQK
jgi:hypothetical protein